MDRGIRNTILGLAGFIALVLGLFLYSFFFARGGLSEEDYAALGFYKFDESRPIADFSLVNQEGKPVGPEDLKGQWSLLFFGFTYCPDICPTTMGVLARAVDRLEQDPQVVLVSVDPERDTPELLQNYLSAFDADFQGYTGEFDEIAQFATSVHVAFGKVPGPTPGSYLVDHSASIVVVDPDGRYAGFIKAPHDEMAIKTIIESLQG